MTWMNCDIFKELVISKWGKNKQWDMKLSNCCYELFDIYIYIYTYIYHYHNYFWKEILAIVLFDEY